MWENEQEYFNDECYCEILQRDKNLQCISRKDSWLLKFIFTTFLNFSLSPSTFQFSVSCRCCCVLISFNKISYVCLYFNCLIFYSDSTRLSMMWLMMMMMMSKKRVNKVGLECMREISCGILLSRKWH